MENVGQKTDDDGQEPFAEGHLRYSDDIKNVLKRIHLQQSSQQFQLFAFICIVYC